ncbi:MAG TPA: hypothetical protein GXX75_11825 [Clostridiales bacterium]|nr:hypothetical protein [Clostridiales bacterium]
MADHWTENESTLSESTKNISRAVKTLIEELEATMFYQQRVDVTNDAELREIMAHNRDEEIEHACMTLEWLRRNMEGWDKELRTYLFSEGSLLEVEGQADAPEAGAAGSESLNIGSLK